MAQLGDSDNEEIANDDLNDPPLAPDESPRRDIEEVPDFNENSDYQEPMVAPARNKVTTIKVAEDDLPSTAGSSLQRSRSTSPVMLKNTGWTSPNAFINYMHDFKESQLEYPGVSGSNFFRLAGERWRRMSKAEKEPYIAGAAQIRKQRVQSKEEDKIKKSERLKSVVKQKKDKAESGQTSENKLKKKPKSRPKKATNQGIFLKVTDSEDASNSDNKSSDISF